MFFEILIAILLGMVFGIICGVTPGIHTNLVAAFLVSISPFLLKFISPLALAVFIITVSVANTFIDSLPSIFLGAPEADMALGVLPGHRYLMRGNGMMAVKLTLIGSFGAVILSLLLFFLFMPIVKYAYPIISNYIGYLLLAVIVFMILRDRKKLWALLIFLLSGVFGLIVLNLQIKEPLFPMLSGLFGVSTLLISLNESNSIPVQNKIQKIKLNWKKTFAALFSGEFSGFLTSFLPGLGAAQAAVISMQITRKLGDHGFMILIGSINTVNFVLSLISWLTIGKARNGSVVAITKLIDASFEYVLIFLAVTLIVAGLSVIAALSLGNFFAKTISKINYKKLVLFIILFIFIMALFLSGFIGIFVLIVSTAIGIIPAIAKTSRTHAMGCLMLPVILYFLPF